MKTLILFRHAKSDWSDGATRDFDRPLNRRGERAAKLMGEWAARNKISFDAIFASSAARVVDTLDHFAKGYGDCPEPHWDRRIYLAASSTLLDVLHEAPSNAESLLMVGHNPGLEDLILDLVPDDGLSMLRDSVEDKFPTASLAILQSEATVWTDFAQGAHLKSFVRPRDLDAALGPEHP